jgi:hypothetical protein
MVWGTGTYGINLSDLKTFYAKYDVDNDVSLVHPMGYPGNSQGDNFGEGTLDAQYISSLGPGITTFVYNSNNSASTEFGLGFGPAMTDFIVALANIVRVLSLIERRKGKNVRSLAAEPTPSRCLDLSRQSLLVLLQRDVQRGDEDQQDAHLRGVRRLWYESEIVKHHKP